MNEILSQKIFILDNDLFSLAINLQLLCNLGCKDVIAFNDEIECIRGLKLQPRVILMDYRTDPQKGLKILKTIKRVQPETYVVFITGKSGIMEALFSLNYGAFEYIIKDKNYASVQELVLNNIQQMETLVYKNPKNT